MAHSPLSYFGLRKCATFSARDLHRPIKPMALTDGSSRKAATSMPPSDIGSGSSSSLTSRPSIRSSINGSDDRLHQLMNNGGVQSAPTMTPVEGRRREAMVTHHQQQQQVNGASNGGCRWTNGGSPIERSSSHGRKNSFAAVRHHLFLTLFEQKNIIIVRRRSLAAPNSTSTST